MKIIIIGLGKIGYGLTKTLVKEGYDVTAIDFHENKVSEIVNKFDANGVIGSGLEREILKEANVDSADYVISCTTKDEVNILCSVLSKKFGAKHTFARVRDPQYYEEMKDIYYELGIDLVFNPEKRTAKDILGVLKFPSAKSVDSFAHGKANLAEFDITGGNPIIGKTIMEISSEYGKDFLFGMVRRGNKVFIPKGDFVILENDVVSVIATEKGLNSFCKQIKIFKPKAKSVFIIGGGKIAYYLAQELIESGVSVKIMENDEARCKELAESLPSAVVLNGDGTDQNVLEEENIKDSDAVITLTGMDEENIIVSLYAKMQKVNKVVTKVDKANIMKMVKNLGLETVVNPAEVISNYVLKDIRSMSFESDEKINKLFKFGDNVEVIDFTIGEDFEGLNVSLKELKLKKDVLIGGIVRNDEFILPDGGTSLFPMDRIIVVASGKTVMELGDILR